MPKFQQYTPEFKDQAIRFVLDGMEPTESRKQACERLAPKLSMNAVTLYNWVKAAVPSANASGKTLPAGSVEELRGQLAVLKKENRELVRANEILRAASAFFGAELDRQSRR